MRVIKNIKRFLFGCRSYFLTLALAGLVVDLFTLTFSSELTNLFLIVIWLLVYWLYRFKVWQLMIVAIGFLIYASILPLSGKEALAEKIAIWAYFFLALVAVKGFFVSFK